ncbi:MAG: DUF2934 domain-containing protein [Chlorobium sp.]|jgi:Protein of unknown function (DUF2934)|nr:MAG: DUF2934 domain-containing protein [Chlorobium sp.]
MAKGTNKAEGLAPDFYEETVSATEQQEEEVRLAAYYLWESKGKEHGSDVEDWVEAEELVKY